jgi:hypothetical protein
MGILTLDLNCGGKARRDYKCNFCAECVIKKEPPRDSTGTRPERAGQARGMVVTETPTHRAMSLLVKCRRPQGSMKKCSEMSRGKFALLGKRHNGILTPRHGHLSLITGDA